MRSGKQAGVITQIHEIYIRATPEAIWNALTTPEWTARYGYRVRQEYTLVPGGQYRAKANEKMRAIGLPEVVIDGEVLEAEPPRKLVQTFRFLFSPETTAEGFTRVT